MYETSTRSDVMNHYALRPGEMLVSVLFWARTFYHDSGGFGTTLQAMGSYCKCISDGHNCQ